MEQNTLGNNEYISQYSNKYSNTVKFNSNGLYEFDSNNFEYMLKLDINTIPLGYGVLTDIQYLSDGNSYAEFIIMRIEDVDVNYKNCLDYDVKILAKNNIKLTAKYDVEIVENTSINNYDINIIIGEDVYNFNSYDILNETSENLDSVAAFSLLDSTYDSKVDVGFYRIYYSSLTDETANSNLELLAQYIGTYMNNAENFFVNQLGYSKPYLETENENELTYEIIYLNYNDKKNDIFNAFSGSTIENIDLSSGIKKVVSTIEIDVNYSLENDLLLNELLLNFLECVCVHEYYHSVLYSNQIFNQWIQESFCTFMELYYIDIYKNIDNVYVKKAMDNRIVNNAFFTSPYSLMYMDTNMENYGYGGSLFLIYLFEKFKTIDFVKSYVLNYLNNMDYDGFNLIATQNNTTLSELLEEFGIFRIHPNYYIQNFSSYYTNDWMIENAFQNVIDANISTNISAKPEAIQKYSWHCIKISRNEMTVDNIVNLNFEINESLSDNCSMYIIQQNGILEPIVDEIITNDLSITIKTNAINLENNNDLFVIILNCSSTIIENPYEFNYSYSSRKNNLGITLSDELNLDLNLGNNSLFSPIGLTYAGLYQFKLELETPINEALLSNTIEIYDSNLNLISKHKYLNNQLSYSKEGENSIIVELTSTFDSTSVYAKPYYLRIGFLGSNIKGKLNIYRIRSTQSIINETAYNTSETFNNYSGDQFIYYNFEVSGTLNITFSISDILEGEQQQIYVVKRVDEFSSFEAVESYYLSVNSEKINIELNTNNRKNFVFMILNGNNKKDLTIDFEFIPNSDFTIELDPSSAHISSIGTEVRLNGGINFGTTITEGYTRVAFLGEDAPKSSRLSYQWTSSNEEVATITQYGTILAISPGFTIIQANYENTLYGQIVIEVLDENRTDQISFTITTDLRQDSQVGTYVSSGKGASGGTDLQVGYTRLISLTDDAPINIIQNYRWVTSDSSIATVSEYGTIKAISPGVVTITGTYIYNSRYVSSITIIIT